MNENETLGHLLFLISQWTKVTRVTRDVPFPMWFTRHCISNYREQSQHSSLEFEAEKITASSRSNAHDSMIASWRSLLKERLTQNRGLQLTINRGNSQANFVSENNSRGRHIRQYTMVWTGEGVYSSSSQQGLGWWDYSGYCRHKLSSVAQKAPVKWERIHPS